MHRLSLLLLCCVLLLSGVEAPPAFALEDDLLVAAFLFAASCDEAVDITAARGEFDALVARIRADLPADRGDPRGVVPVLNRHLLHEREVSYLSNLYWRDSLITAALVRKRGNCVATSLLYYLVAQELDLPIDFAGAPRHAYVRWQNERASFAIETTDGGRVLPADHAGDLSPADRADAGYGRSLTDTETRAVLLDIWADTLRSLDRDDEAEAVYRQAIALWSENLALRLDLAALLKNRGELAAARTIAEFVREHARGTLFVSHAEGLIAGLESNLHDFQRALDRVARVLPGVDRETLPAAIHQIGGLYRHQRKFPEAITAHRIATWLRPDADAWNALGSALTEAHRDEEAIAAYEQALALNNEDFFPKVILAGLYERIGQTARGRALFASIAEPKGRRLAWLCALVWYDAVTGQEEALLEHMRQALEYDSGHGTINYFLREPDLDPYAHLPAVRTLWQAHLPPGVELPPPAPAPEIEASPAAAVAADATGEPTTGGAAPTTPASIPTSSNAWIMIVSLVINGLLVLACITLYARRRA